jgi:hypothetical protein
MNVASIYTGATLLAQAFELRIRLARRVRNVPLPQILAELTPAKLPSVSISPSEVWRVLRLVEALCRRMRVVPDSCLYRALTRYAVLRRAGYAAKFVMGMDPRARDDLTAHAWVELDASPYKEALDARMVVTYVYPDEPARQ